MPLVAAQCTNCGGTLQVDDSKDAAICQYCGTPFIVEKAVQNYQIHNSYNIENANIIMNDDKSFDKRLASAEEYMYHLKDYAAAYKIFAEIESIAPGNHKVWYGKICSRTLNFNGKATASMIAENPGFYKELERDIDNAYRTASAEERAIFHDKITIFLNECKVALQSIIADLGEMQKGVNVKGNQHKDNINDIVKNNKSIDKKIRKMNFKANAIYFFDKVLKFLMKIVFVIGSLWAVGGLTMFLASYFDGDKEHMLLAGEMILTGILPTVILFIIHKVLERLWYANANKTQEEEERIKENISKIGGQEWQITEGAKQIEDYAKRADACQGYMRWIDEILAKYSA